VSAAYGRYISLTRELVQRRSTASGQRLPGGLEQNYEGQIKLAWSLMTERERSSEETKENTPESLFTSRSAALVIRQNSS
jgi:hypothetical protein